MSNFVSSFATLDQLSVQGKTVLLRADLNVPMKDGAVTDDSRLTRLVPTLKDLAAARAKIVILSHFGRPDGKPDPKYSLRPVAAELQKIWGQPVAFADDCTGPAAQKAVAALAPGGVLVLENTRFHPGEEANDLVFAKQLAALGDVYVNDAFSAAHRAHASTAALAKLLPAAAGRLMQAELTALEKALGKPEHPVAALVGGSKISTKLDLLENLVAKVDVLVLGGGMANTFLAAQGVAVGKSLYEKDMLDTARAIAAKADSRGCKIILPTDAVVATALQANIATQTVSVNAVPADSMMLDIGPQSAQAVIAELHKCKTLVWNGPLGAFEFPPFDNATNLVAQAAASLTRQGKLLSVAGGGDTVSALANAGVTDQFSYVSTAGGAFLEWLEGKTLPGVAALEK
ncbi:MAG: phosphoglycerate kinase [Alphaproteobacteria bacterium]|nr:phosphoglycerate kinase [Alphaproteobacteria bacterium]